MRIVLRILVAFTLLILLLAGGGMLWLVRNEAAAETALRSSLESHLKAESHFETMRLDIWQDFPFVSLVLDDVWVLGTGQDTLLQARQLAMRCNGIKLIRGSYALESVKVSDGRVRLVSDAAGNWNTDVWNSDNDSVGDQADFAVRSLEIENLQVQVDDHEMMIPDGLVELEWAGNNLHVDGTGNFANYRSPQWTFSDPLLWSGQCDWNASEQRLESKIDRIDWLDALFEAEMVYQAQTNAFEIQGHVHDLKVTTILHQILGLDPASTPQTSATSSGTWSWANGTFKSTLQLPMAQWDIPFRDVIWPVNGAASVWVKYESNQWRLDVPSIELTTEGLHWLGKVEQLDPLALSFSAIGELGADWNKARTNLLKAWPSLPWPASGATTWDGTWRQGRNGLSNTNGAWNATACKGVWSGLPYAIDAQGNVTEQSLLIQSLEGFIDGVQLQASGNLNDPLDLGTGALRGQLDVQVDRYVYETEPNDPDVPLASLMLPKGSALQYSIQVNQFQYGLWTAEDIEAKGVLNDQLWRVQRFTSKTLDGELNGDGSLTFLPQDRRAIVEFHPVVKACNLPRLFQSFEDFGQATIRADHLAGELSVSGSVRFAFEDVISWKSETLEMLVTAEVKSGSLRHLEAFDEIADYLRDNRMMAPWVDPDDLESRLKFVEFGDLESPIYVSKSQVQLPHINIESSAMNITLQGRYGFDSSIDYSMGFAMRDLRNTRSDEFGPIEDDGLGQQFFIAMEGTVDEPTYRWDREAQKDHRKENFQREKDLLKDLFRRSSP